MTGKELANNIEVSLVGSIFCGADVSPPANLFGRIAVLIPFDLLEGSVKQVDPEDVR